MKGPLPRINEFAFAFAVWLWNCSTLRRIAEARAPIEHGAQPHPVTREDNPLPGEPATVFLQICEVLRD
jgi:hypothetical protein